MKKRDFKVGQKYRIRVINDKDTIIEIKKVTKEKIFYNPIKNCQGLDWFEIGSYFYDNLELIDEKPSIHIYQDGSEVKAIKKLGKEIVKTSVAKCSPEDEFDFNKGASLAFKRLFEPTLYNAKLVCVDNGTDDFKVGRIYEVKDGLLLSDDGDKYGKDIFNGIPFKELKEINKIMKPDFIELVE